LAGIMLFFFGQSDRLECRHQGDGLASCTVSHVLLGTVPLPGWQASGISEAYVEHDCPSDGCTYRTALRTQGGSSQPISEVWTDQQAQDLQLADEVNAFISNSEAPTLVVDQQPQAWVIWLVGGLAVMAVVIQGLALIAQIVRALFRVGRNS
jgi:hypothetical protein